LIANSQLLAFYKLRAARQYHFAKIEAVEVRLADENKERWKVLCERAIKEQNPREFLATIQDLIEELERKEQQLKGITPPAPNLPANASNKSDHI
jgi:hypothetical protein